MKRNIFTILSICSIAQLSTAQVVLNADGPGNTYEDINAVLSLGHDVVEVPDCAHSSFGRHIDEVFDKELNAYVFRFIAHKAQDNDRCKKFDRQRIEIKTYGKSPENTKGTKGETVEYKWKFKLPSNFAVSKNFTHLHQIKSVGSEYSSKPIISFTARKGTPDKLELRHAPTDEQNTLKSVELDLLKGHWVEVTEVIHYSNKGSYALEIKKVSNGAKVFEYSNENIDMWQDGSNFMRPKWGIYRSLKRQEDLKDEMVLFNNFSIDEIPEITLDILEKEADTNILKVNTKKNVVDFKKHKADNYDSVQLFDSEGSLLPTNKNVSKNKIMTSDLRSGWHYIAFLKTKRPVKVLKFLIK